MTAGRQFGHETEGPATEPEKVPKRLQWWRYTDSEVQLKCSIRPKTRVVGKSMSLVYHSVGKGPSSYNPGVKNLTLSSI